VEGHDIGVGQRRLQRGRREHAIGQVWPTIGIVGEHAHAERARERRHPPADGPEADHGQGGLGEVAAAVDALFPVAFAHAPIEPGQALGERQHHGERVLGHRGGVRSRRDRHRNPAFGRRLHVDGVDADPVLGDQPQPLGGADRCAPDARHAHQDGFRLQALDGSEQRALVGIGLEQVPCEPRRAQHLQPGLGERRRGDQHMRGRHAADRLLTRACARRDPMPGGPPPGSAGRRP
jgi:hypothetical protein